MSKRNVRVTIPTGSPDKLLKLIATIIAKHTALGPASPIEDIDMALFGSLNATAVDLRKLSEEARAKAEVDMLESKTALGIAPGQGAFTEATLYHLVLLIRNLLLFVYNGQEEKLEEFGFNVVISLSSSPTPSEEGGEE